jgi:hypothetical protein
VSDFGESYTYIKESAIGTAVGDAAASQDIMLENEWQTTDKSGYFSFNSNGTFEYSLHKETEDGWVSFETAGSGSWVLEGDVLNLAWEDGTEDACDFFGNYFYVSSLDATVFNGIADAGVLESWYGRYEGELGEIIISDSIFDNSIDVSIYLNDEIGSMLDTSLELEPDGSAASDEYITLHLDGSTLTIEPLNANFDNYAGTFDKQ